MNKNDSITKNNTQISVQVKGMHCASCSSIIEKTLKKTEGVESIEVNPGTEKAKISFDSSKTNPQALSSKIEPLGYSLVIPTNLKKPARNASYGDAGGEKLAEIKDMRNKVFSTIPLVIISIFIMTWGILSQFKIVAPMTDIVSGFFHHLLPIMATYVLFIVGKPYLVGVYRFLRFGKANMDTLIGIGTSVAFIYSFIITAFEGSLKFFINVEHTYYDVVIVVIAFIALGKYLEARAKVKTGDAIEKLLNLQTKTALVVRDGKKVEISIDQVLHGDLIIVKPGSSVPVDGLITEGSSYIDESMITGEPMPIQKKIGDSVVAGTMNTTGSFIFKAIKIGSETMLAHIIKMVEEAQGSKAPIQALADKISGVFVPIVLALSFIALGLWLLIGTQYLGFSQALSYGLVSFVGILVIACPCALGLATPTAIIVGVGKGAQEGILIKDAGTLEKLGKATVLVVDKTGTLTRGKPELVLIQNFSDKKDNELVSIIATLENKSEHPISHAVMNYVKEKNISLDDIKDFENIKGQGIKGTINGIEYFVGNLKLVKDLNVSFDITSIEKETIEGKTPVILTTKPARPNAFGHSGGGKVLGVVMVADAIKDEAVEAVNNLHKIGIKVVMLTGDNKNTAKYIGKLVGVDEVVAEVMPEDKLNKIRELQKEGHVVVMAGDGVNDAPALAAADVGIAMATGTDVAIESAGITLLHGDISKLVKAVNLSKMTMRGIKQNLFWAFIYNIIGIPLAGGLFFPIFGWLLSPVFAGFAMAFSSVSVVGNSLRLKVKKL